MARMPGQVVDLTFSDSDEEDKRRKRRRSNRTEPLAEDSDVQVIDCGPSDVEVVGQRNNAQGHGDNVDLGDEDLVITNATGQVATRDLPHPRPDCADHGFTPSTSASNATHCSQCFCYVCDLKASECRYWGTGTRERDHANARPLGYWLRLREEARHGNRGLVHSEYHGNWPLGTRLPPKQQANSPPVGARRLPPGVSTTRAGAADGSAAENAGSDPGGTGDGNELGTMLQAALPSEVGYEGLWDMLRSLAPAGQSAAALLRSSADAGAGPSRAAAPAAAAGAPPPPPAAAPAGPQVAHKAQPGKALLPSGKCSLRPLPDPAKDRHAFELGTLQFSVKAIRGLTVAAIAGRMERFGFYFNGSNRPDEYGDRLALENVFETRCLIHGGTYKAKALYLKLMPLPPAPEDTGPLSTQRIRKVLVIDCLGRARPTIFGVRVQDKTKRADLLLALQPMLRPLFSPDDELLHVFSAEHLERNPVRAIEPEQTLDDAFFETYSCASEGQRYLIVFRTGKHPSPTWSANAAASTSGGGSYPRWTHMPTYSHSASGGTPSVQIPGRTPAWALGRVRQFKPPPAQGSTVLEGSNFSTTHLTFPVLVPLAKQHAKGGREAGKDFSAAIMRALQPYRTHGPLSPAHHAPAAVLRGNRWNLMERPPQISSNHRWDAAGDSIGNWQPGSLLPQLTAVIGHDLPASSYRVDEMGTPIMDPTAAPEAMRESIAAIAEIKRRNKAAKLKKELPSQCILELTRAMRRAHPEDKAALAQCPNSCTVAVDLSLVSSSRADPRLGKAIIKVYAWSCGSVSRSSLFKPWDEWPSLGRREHMDFPLSHTLLLLSTGMADPNGPQPAAPAAGATDTGPSTSSARPVSGGAAAGSVLQQRIRAERQRARDMYTGLRALQDTYGRSQFVPARSVNALLDFMQSGERPPAQQPLGLTVVMRPYQLQSLGFMVDMERLVDVPTIGRSDNGNGGGSSAGAATSAGGPAAAPLQTANPDAVDGGCPGGYRRLFWLPVSNSQGQRYWYSPVFHRLSSTVPIQPVGGFLAEEMGLGKTVEVMALILANPAPSSVVAGSESPCGRLVSRATLVVCAVSLVGQWQAEAQNKTSGSCRIHPYHGANRIRDPKRLATEFDVVVTTYQTLQCDHASGKPDPCQAIKWHRIVFDEGHQLKSVGAKMAKAAVELTADRKWLCTGTPINNGVDDLLGQFSAIHLMPLGKKTYFDSYIKMPFVGCSQGGDHTILPLLYALRHIMIRHTKTQDLGGQDVLQLPPKTEMDVPVLLTAAEQALYWKLHKEAQRGWQTLKKAGDAYVKSHIFAAMSMLMPLRRICSGGLLKPRDLMVPDPECLPAVAAAAGGAAGGSAAGGSQDVTMPDDISECPICVDTLDQPVVTPCNHWFCRECLTGWINATARPTCPACRQPVSLQTLRRGVEAQPPTLAAEGSSAEGEASEAVPCESKLRALMEELRAMREADPTAKALVFTQFSQPLEWLKQRLLEEDFGHRMITGDMTQRRRTEAIDSFQHDPGTSVFLLSIRSGAVGINLTAANHVFLLEPCMNPAMEEQAIGRSWRMGQQRPVVVKRLFVKGSVEERIMEMVKSRRASSRGSAAAASDAGAVAGLGGARGSAAVAKTDLRINELELMFADPRFPAAAAAQ